MRTTKFHVLTALLMAGTVFAACSNDDNIIDGQPVSEQYTLTIDANKGGDGAQTRALSISSDATKLTATWATTENVYVKKGNSWATGSLVPQSNGTTAILKGTLSDITISEGDDLTLQFPKKDDRSPYTADGRYSGQKGTLADIAANYDYAIATAKVTEVNSGNITADAVTFESQQAIVRVYLYASSGTGSNAISPSSITLSIDLPETYKTSLPSEYQALLPMTYSLTGLSLATYEANKQFGVLYLALPGLPATLATYKDNFTLSIRAIDDGKMYTYTKTGYPFENGNFYWVRIKMTYPGTQRPEGLAAVDLGLSSGTKWANMNVGAASETDYGKYFAWGEIWGYTNASSYDKNDFSWNTYMWGVPDGDEAKMTKYCNNSIYGYNGFSDNKSELEVDKDDAARANWGDNWKMPTKSMIEELISTKTDNTNYTWTWYDGSNNKYDSSSVAGWEIKNNTTNKKIFLPAAGKRDGTAFVEQNIAGYYWSSELYEGSTNPRSGANLKIGSDDYSIVGNPRSLGFSIRPVYTTGN